MPAFDDSSAGQLRDSERALLRRGILDARPDVVVEAGTWYGGGSTFTIAKALRENRRGMLYTVEAGAARSHTAFMRYLHEQHQLLPYITFICADSETIIKACLFEVDVFMCDGGDRLRDVLAIEDKMRNGGAMYFHDWQDEKEIPAREHIELSSLWDVVEVVDSLALVRKCES